MSITTESIMSTRTYIEERMDDTTNPVDNHTETLIIVLTVTLSIVTIVAIIITIIIIHRRRYSTFRLNKLQNSSRLKQIVVNLTPTSIRLQYPRKKLYLSHRQYQQPHTKTIVYNYMNAPGSPVVYNQLKLPIKGETNAAFDGCLVINEQQPILKSIAMIEQPDTTLQTEFPASLQAPVPSITPIFVETIANHRRTLLTNTSATPSEISTTSSDCSRDSGTSSSNSSQKILLFSQRTEF